ncbi:hypothetical protein [Burkholderia puraquae]|uniref:hypothetical protein n=1 Tax=Burkholderia puraquae TaxID=1904757 RepID=UPI0010555647|nr:hypothetical protein [Burkholderia puraquae]
MKHHYIGCRNVDVRRRVAGAIPGRHDDSTIPLASRSSTHPVLRENDGRHASPAFNEVVVFSVVDVKTESISKFVFNRQFVRLIAIEFDPGGALSIERSRY